jgi:hypothetical protein
MALPIFGSCLRATAEDSDGGDRDGVPARTPRANDARSIRGSERILTASTQALRGRRLRERIRQTPPALLPYVDGPIDLDSRPPTPHRWIDRQRGRR